MEQRTGKATPLTRYWPVLVVVALIAGAAAFSAVRSDRNGGETVPARQAADEGPPAWQWGGGDPMEAPDCDPVTGRIKVPTLSAPNCVPLWPGGKDNGGSTGQGVHADKIVVARYVAPASNVQRSPGGLAAEPSEAEIDADRLG